MAPVSPWRQLRPVAGIRAEALFGDRVVSCFPDRPANLDGMLRRSVAHFGEREALVFQQERFTYHQFDALVERVAAGLLAQGLRPGERIGVYMGNSAALMATLFGALRAGLIVVPMGIRLQAAELEYILNDCTAAALAFDADTAARLPERARLPSVRSYSAIAAELPTEAALASLLAPVGTAVPTTPSGEQDTAFIIYTSGTTGHPKGAELAHIGLWHGARHSQLCVGYDHESRTMLAIPGSHIAGLSSVVMTSLQAGACMTVVRTVDAREILRLLKVERITVALFVPTVYTRLLLEPDFGAFDLGEHLRVCHYGGSPMPEATAQRLREHLPHVRLSHGYGATETNALCTLLPGDKFESHLNSVGAAIHCMDVCVMDENGRELPVGETGELWIGGPAIAKGYWNNPEQTARAFVGGYWRSGDIGRMDTDGFLWILDRQKDMIIRGGFKVFSAEVENVLSSAPGVIEAAVVPSPDPVLGERSHAFVYVEPGVAPETVRDFCRQRLADYKVPDYVTVQTEPLPRNLNGKLMKAPLRERADTLAGQR